MNSFLKTNRLWLSLLGLAIFLVILASVFSSGTPDYQKEIDSSLRLIQDPSLQIKAKDLADKQLIDIRTSDSFAFGHPQNAVNLPLRQLLEKESLDYFSQQAKSGIPVVLCGENELQATAPWLLLQQMGYHNILLLNGKIGVNGEIADTDLASSETSVIDPKAIQPASVQIQIPIRAPEKKTPETIIPKRKEATSGGGC
jgi:rhodanese-related sulfurtransferase